MWFVAVESLSHVRFFVTPQDGSAPGFPVLYYLLEVAAMLGHIFTGSKDQDLDIFVMGEALFSGP